MCVKVPTGQKWVTGSLGAGVTGVRELPDKGTGITTLSSDRKISTLNHWETLLV